MIEEVMKNICEKNGLKQISGTTLTFIDSTKTEGVDLWANKPRAFFVKDFQKVYEEPPSDKIQKVLFEIQKSISDIQPDKQHEAKKEPEKKEEKQPDKKEIAKTDVPDAIIPEVFTPSLIEKWSKMKTIDRMMMFQHTPKERVKMVKVGKDESGKDIYAPYVEGNFMFKEANAAFLFDWKLENIVISVCPTGVSCIGTLYVWFEEKQKYMTRPASGYQEMNKKIDIELAKKGAITDAVKKGLSLFGFNSDVYGGDV